MPQLRTSALVCSVRQHGEHGVIARLLTPENGLIAGYVRGGRSRRVRPILIPGNAVEAQFRARTSDQLPGLTVELRESRAPWLSEPLNAAAIDWATALSAAILVERQHYPGVPDALQALLDAICHAPSARGWARALLRYEWLLLNRLGFGAPMIDRPDRSPEWPQLLDGLHRSGELLERDLLEGRRAIILPTRQMLIERLKRAVA